MPGDYRKRNGKEEEILKDVIFMERTKDGWVVKALLEEPTRVQGQIERMRSHDILGFKIKTSMARDFGPSL